jgi:hypothetical protein
MFTSPFNGKTGWPSLDGKTTRCFEWTQNCLPAEIRPLDLPWWNFNASGRVQDVKARSAATLGILMESRPYPRMIMLNPWNRIRAMITSAVGSGSNSCELTPEEQERVTRYTVASLPESNDRIEQLERKSRRVQ